MLQIPTNNEGAECLHVCDVTSTVEVVQYVTSTLKTDVMTVALTVDTVFDSIRSTATVDETTTLGTGSVPSATQSRGNGQLSVGDKIGPGVGVPTAVAADFGIAGGIYAGRRWWLRRRARKRNLREVPR